MAQGRYGDATTSYMRCRCAIQPSRVSLADATLRTPHDDRTATSHKDTVPVQMQVHHVLCAPQQQLQEGIHCYALVLVHRPMPRVGDTTQQLRHVYELSVRPPKCRDTASYRALTQCSPINQDATFAFSEHAPQSGQECAVLQLAWLCAVHARRANATRMRLSMSVTVHRCTCDVQVRHALVAGRGCPTPLPCSRCTFHAVAVHKSRLHSAARS